MYVAPRLASPRPLASPSAFSLLRTQPARMDTPPPTGARKAWGITHHRLPVVAAGVGIGGVGGVRSRCAIALLVAAVGIAAVARILVVTHDAHTSARWRGWCRAMAQSQLPAAAGRNSQGGCRWKGAQVGAGAAVRAVDRDLPRTNGTNGMGWAETTLVRRWAVSPFLHSSYLSFRPAVSVFFLLLLLLLLLLSKSARWSCLYEETASSLCLTDIECSILT